MRRRATLIGWPGRDPRHYRFAVPNAVRAQVAEMLKNFIENLEENT